MTEPSKPALRRMSPFRASAGLDRQVDGEVLSDDERDSITRRLTTNMIGAGILAVGLFIEHTSVDRANVAQLIQAAAALTVSVGLFARALRGFLARPARDFTEQLVALAVLAAMSAGDFVSAALVPLLLEIGHLFEERSALGAQAAIQRLRELCARPATIVADGKEKTMAADEIQRGAVAIVRPGELVPADGRISSGHASIDQSPVTGESDPKDVGPGDKVFTGTVNLDGTLRIKVESTGHDTVLGEVVRVLREVEDTKIPIVRLLEAGAAAYLPFVVTLAATVLMLTGELSRFVTVLVVACPCALVLAAPAAMVAAMSAATKHSVLVKNAAFLETIALVDTLVLDKTGTITDGVQSVDTVHPQAAYTEHDVLHLAAAVAHGSLHPASLAIVNEAKRRKFEYPTTISSREFSGRGVEATIDQDVVRIGRASWLTTCGVLNIDDSDTAGVWVSRGKEVVGFISLFDHTRTETASAIAEMRALGFSRIVLLTGDKLSAANRVADELCLDDYFAEVLPAEKLDIVRREQQSGKTVLMVGDGVNDALALAAADVGIAVGERMNNVALGGADVAILTNDISRLPFVVRHADRTQRIIIENVVIGLTFSIGMLGLASLGLINPLAGALFHNAGAIFVVLNSSRLLERNTTTTETSSKNGCAERGTAPPRQDQCLGDRNTLPDSPDTKPST